MDKSEFKEWHEELQRAREDEKYEKFQAKFEEEKEKMNLASTPKEYYCIFEEQKCPVRTIWKLKPESLVSFCGICSKNPTKQQEFKTILQMFAGMLDIYRRLGAAEEKAKFYEELAHSPTDLKKYWDSRLEGEKRK